MLLDRFGNLCDGFGSRRFGLRRGGSDTILVLPKSQVAVSHCDFIPVFTGSMRVDWGDDSVDVLVSGVQAAHNYAIPYTGYITIKGIGVLISASPITTRTSSIIPAMWSAIDRLSPFYTGALLRIRRLSDDAETDIGYDATNHVDLDAIAAFDNDGGSDQFYVVTLYDQSGNGYDLSNSTAINQPELLLAQFGIYPVMDFTGSQWLEAANDTILDVTTGGVSLICWFRSNKLDGDVHGLLNKKRSYAYDGYSLSISSSERIYARNGHAATIEITSTGTTNVCDNLWRQGSMTLDGTVGVKSQSVYLNGSAIAEDTDANISLGSLSNAYKYAMGVWTDAYVFPLTGQIHTAFAYENVVSDADRLLIYNNINGDS